MTRFSHSAAPHGLCRAKIQMYVGRRGRDTETGHLTYDEAAALFFGGTTALRISSERETSKAGKKCSSMVPQEG